jgi:hypothetical protein
VQVHGGHGVAHRYLLRPVAVVMVMVMTPPRAVVRAP